MLIVGVKTHTSKTGRPRRKATRVQSLDAKEDYPVKVSPWHSVKPYEPQVYHNDTQCKTGNNIEPVNRREGTGGRPLCKECAGYR